MMHAGVRINLPLSAASSGLDADCWGRCRVCGN